MTILDDRPLLGWHLDGGPSGPVRPHPVRNPARRRPPASPVGSRPPVAPMPHRGTGVPVSRAAHGRRGVSTSVTVALAGLAALITLWLGSLANLSGDRAVASAPVPDRLAVVQVQAGETLQQLAARVAPGAPAGQIVDRIKDLNQLDSAAVDAGQTLIAPIG